MHSHENWALGAIEMPGLIATIGELVAIESCHGHEVAVQRRMADLLREIGMEVDEWDIDLDTLRKHPAYGAEIEREHAVGVVGRWGSGTGPTLILNGHVDVVPAGDLSRWTVPPFQATVRQARVYGRGAVDMKGPLCCALEAVRAIQRAGITLGGTVVIQSVVGEEDGGLGTLATIQRGHTGDAAIILEPTELMIAPAQAGALSFRITIPGLAAHGALRTEGANPLESLPGLLYALEELETERCARLAHPLFSDYEVPYAICIGKVHGGVWASTVPEALVLEGRYGVGIGEDLDAARAELEDAVETAAAEDDWLVDHPPVVEWWGARFEPAAIAADHPLVTMLSSALESVTREVPVIRGMPYGADMHLLVNQGKVPTVLFGPGDVRVAHAPDEFVPIAELEVATRALVVAILRYCGVAGG
ncbi:MAG: ArgE/DapE family deacylase [Gemmatimonadales bacterium]